MNASTGKMLEPIVRIENVSKQFGGFTAVDDVSVDIPRNSFFALLGPSGCGKTTLLRMLAGFESPSAGRIAIDGEDMARVPPNRRPVNMVFQSYAVFPHMTVFDNVGYGLRVTGVSKNDMLPRVEEALAMVRLQGFEGRKPDQLSGGQRQRVALARALVKRPKLLLLDEPLSALDRKLREDMQLELVRLQHEVGITFVMVTHDQDEALSTATDIAVMEKGKILQAAPPRELYERPTSRFVASFIGTMNLLPARLRERRNGHALVDVLGATSLPVPHEGSASDTMTFAIRPEKLRFNPDSSDPGLAVVDGTIRNAVYYGDYYHVYIAAPTGEVLQTFVHASRRQAGLDLSEGRACRLGFSPEDALLLPD